MGRAKQSWGSQQSRGANRGGLQVALSAPEVRWGQFLCFINIPDAGREKHTPVTAGGSNTGLHNYRRKSRGTYICMHEPATHTRRTSTCRPHTYRRTQTHTETQTQQRQQFLISTIHISAKHESKCFQCHCPPTSSSVHHYTIRRAIYSCIGKLRGTAASQEYQSNSVPRTCAQTATVYIQASLGSHMQNAPLILWV